MFRWIDRVRSQRHLNIHIFNSEDKKLANIKSAKKRILVNETRAAKNKAIRSRVKTTIKKVDAAVLEKNKDAANAALKDAIVEITKAGSKGVYHKKTVSRKVSRLTKTVNELA